MGTLTADCPRLDTHCAHKLATSCRLTSTLDCCACADERPHSRTYRVYIDGVGFVQRGTRWQGYCWFCKEFWTNRLAATEPPLDIPQTRIPEIPDQTIFLERWFEFHQGFRIATLPDGTEQRIAVLGEPLGEVSPGFLPRTLDQLRAGIDNDTRRLENRVWRRRLTSEDERPDEPQQSLEDALDSLLDAELDNTELSSTELSSTELSSTEEPSVPTMATRQDTLTVEGPVSETAFRRQRAHERLTRVFGTREDVQQDDYESPLSTMYNRAWNRYRQAEDLRATGDNIAPSLQDATAQERRDIEEQLLWGVMRESQPGLEHHEPEGQVWSYSPVGSNNVVTESGALDVTITPPWPAPPDDDTQPRSGLTPELAARARAAYLSLTGDVERLAQFSSDRPEGRPPRRRLHAEADVRRRLEAAPNTAHPFSTGLEPRSNLEYYTNELERLRVASEAVASARHALHAHRDANTQPPQTLDNQSDRPAPKSDEEMTKVLACQVCYQQVADIALLPCGHMVMCQWCADIVIPVKHTHLPIRPSNCPMCRKQVKQRFRIHTG